MANLQNLTINDIGFLKLPNGSATNRPTTNQYGNLRFNTDLGLAEIYTENWNTASSANSSVIQNGLSCYLDANNPESYPGVGNTWFDISGNSRHFTWLSTPNFQQDRIKYFKTLNNRCQGPPSNSFGIDNTSGYTIFLISEQITLNESAAFKFYSSGSVSDSRGIFSHATWSNDKVYFDQGRPNGNRIEAASLGSKQWNIWVYQRDGDYLSLWRNDIPIANNSYEPVVDIDLINQPVDLGSDDQYGGNNSDWDARLAGFLVYNRGLTQEEIKYNIQVLRQKIPIDSLNNVIGRSENYPALSAWTIKQADPSSSSGIYWISPEGRDDSFQVYCDMETDGGGWVLIDSLLQGESISSRTLGANLNPRQTKGSYLPAYSWSVNPQLLGKSREYTGFAPWRTLNVISERGRRYPTDPDPNNGSSGVSGDFSYGIDNGNARVGTLSWLYEGSGRIGTIWIGNGSDSTMAIGYTGGSTGLGDNFGSSDSSSYVR